jgi:triosephosphate isomerase
MDVFNLDPVSAAILLGMVAGVVECLKRAFAKDWKAVAIIVGAGVTGALVALSIAINPLIGAVVGLAASGFITIAQNVGHN